MSLLRESLLRELNQAGVLRTLDDALAQSLRRLDPDTADEVLAAAALASLAVSQGHAALDLERPRELTDAPVAWPSPEAWRVSLAASRWVAMPETVDVAAGAAPLVLENGLLYLRRYREYERRLAVRLRRLAEGWRDGGMLTSASASTPTPELELETGLAPGSGEKLAGSIGSSPPSAEVTASLSLLFQQLFPLPTADEHQARAAALSQHRPVLLVTGGPGTGKTTTIARMLALRIAAALQVGAPPPRIALAAPTGRAAERMAESLRRASQAMREAGVDPGVLDALPVQAGTVHRLLGVVPDTPHFRHHADNPLPHDIVVVDEASMVDLPLMCKLAEAVADGAQLVLLGDPDQLPSVEAGDVLAAILGAAKDGNVSPDRTGGFGAVRVHLQRGYRQSGTLELGPLAEAVRTGDAPRALSLLRAGDLGGITFHEGVEDPLQAHGPALLAHWRALAEAADPAQGLRLANRLRLLTALREGPQGARGLNARIEALLSGQRLGSPPAWFPGRLLLVVENSYRHRLFNGDVGLCLPGDDGVPWVWFPGESAEDARAFHPAALPRHESAFAMTVHKAQGSEFDEVWLQLPRVDSRVLTRELVYTGMTRARQGLHVAGSARVVEAALGRHAGRVSGLGERLDPSRRGHEQAV